MSDKTKENNNITKVPGEATQNGIPFPSSPLVLLIMETFASRDSLKTLANRKNAISKGSTHTEVGFTQEGSGKVTVGQKQKKTTSATITITKGTDTAELKIPDIEALTTMNKAVLKFFPYILTRLYNIVKDGEPHRDYVSFSLEDVVADKLYKSKNAARAGFEQAMDVLIPIQLKGSSRKGRKRTLQKKGTTLFDAWEITDGICYTYLNKHFEWDFICQYWAWLPDCYFTLPERAQLLLFYASFVARQHTKEISENKSFSLSFRAIHSFLNLPGGEDENGEIKFTKNPFRDTIQKGILDPVSIINEAIGSEDFTITPEYDTNYAVPKIVDTGRLLISIKGEYARKFIEIAAKQEKRIESAAKKKSEIVDTAKALNLAKKIEAAAADTIKPDKPILSTDKEKTQ